LSQTSPGAGRPRVLVIDDEPQIHRFLTPALEAAGYAPTRADTADAGLREIARRAPDAVILDLGLPDMDGKEALERARRFYQGPILVLSARDRETEKIDALDLGADDYVEKPFGVGELLARLRATLRRGAHQEERPKVVRGGELEIDIGMRTVRRAGELIRLSPKEFDLLGRLVEGGGRVLTHRQLLTAVWGAAHEQDVQYLRVFIGQLRQKLESDPAAPRHVVTEAGVGYRFIAE
jgi:two-component system KDP operon response regulator KdpE